jgi:hypothetical protein
VAAFEISRLRSQKGPAKLTEVLADVIGRLGLERNLDDYRIWSAWDEVVGPAVARNAQPVRLQARRLVVAVKNATWMHELTLLRRDLCERLNTWMGREVVSELFLVVGRVEPVDEAQRRRARPTPAVAEEPRPADVNAAIERLWKALRERDAGR